ncbi:MAG: Ig-like domain-containing protein, partial [Thermoplasmata archaeon]
IIVTFDMPMNTSILDYNCAPDPGGWNVSWNSTNTTATLTHNLFETYTNYTFNVTNAQSALGKNLVAGPVPNPWNFSTGNITLPKITSTSPPNGGSNIALNQNVVVWFNKAMNTSTVTYSCSPDPGGWGVGWSGGDTVATFTHNNFVYDTTYWFEITGGLDEEGLNLTPGPVPNPWYFSTVEAPGPRITTTSPVANATDVNVTNDIVVIFDTQVNQSSVNYTCTPDPGGWNVSWSGNDTIATFTHNPFAISTSYTFQITEAKDLSNNNLQPGPVPNPWSFTTGNATNPFINSTFPVNGNVWVNIWDNITVNFSKPMNIGTVTLSSSPDPGGWYVNWSANNSYAVFHHNNFQWATTYTITISGKDVSGNNLVSGPVPNPWSFTTQGVKIESTSPYHNQMGVSIDASVVVIFSKSMNTPTVTYSCSPNPGSFNVSWANSNTEATFSIINGTFAYSTKYTFRIISGQDIYGQGLTSGPVPNPWNFYTTDSQAPQIISTSPQDHDTGVELNKQIIVVFSEEMDTNTVTHNCNPDPGGWSLSWLYNGSVAIYTHNLFTASTTYLFKITSGKDLSGNHLTSGAVNNPFIFTTATPTDTTVSVRVTSPNGGEDWMKGENYPITWDATGNFNSTAVDLYYSTDNGQTWTSIATGIPNTGYYNWTVPNIETAGALIKVVVTDTSGNSASDTSDASFAIDPPPPRAMEILSPAFGTVWGAGTHTVSWQVSNAIGLENKPGRLQYTTDGGTTWTILAEDLSITDTYKWTIPEGMNSDNCYVKLELKTLFGEYEFTTSSVFVIDTEAPTISHVKPTEAYVDEPLTIKAKIVDNFNVVNAVLYYRAEGDSEYQYQIMSLENGEYTVTLTPLISGDIYYYIMATDGANIVETELYDLEVKSSGVTDPEPEDDSKDLEEQNGQWVLYFSVVFLIAVILISLILNMFIKKRRKNIKVLSGEPEIKKVVVKRVIKRTVKKPEEVTEAEIPDLSKYKGYL